MRVAPRKGVIGLAGTAGENGERVPGKENSPDEGDRRKGVGINEGVMTQKWNLEIF